MSPIESLPNWEAIRLCSGCGRSFKCMTLDSEKAEMGLSADWVTRQISDGITCLASFQSPVRRQRSQYYEAKYKKVRSKYTGFAIRKRECFCIEQPSRAVVKGCLRASLDFRRSSSPVRRRPCPAVKLTVQHRGSPHAQLRWRHAHFSSLPKAQHENEPRSA